MTPTQRTRIIEVIVAELKDMRNAAIAAGLAPAAVDAELDRRRQAIVGRRR